MNRSSRQFHTLLKDALHRIRDGVYTEHERDQLEEARRDHRDRYAEAQMIVPERVLDASRAVNEVLAATDAAVKRLDRGLTRDGESAEETLLDLKEAEPRLAAMRRLMRADLGVTE
jgi:ribosome-associated translation inhibitor RaiA